MWNEIPALYKLDIVSDFLLQPDAPKNSEEYLQTYRDEWREVFIISAMVYVFGAIIYLILGAGEKQPWADGVRRRKHVNERIPTSLQDSCECDEDKKHGNGVERDNGVRTGQHVQHKR